jgi:thioredoxin-like negative regulator of GroEL
VVHQVAGDRFHASDLPPGRTPVMFTADWCGYCTRFVPHYKRLREGWIVDISDEDDPLWDTLAIRVVPTVVVFEAGAPGKRWAGVLAAHHVDQIEAYLAEAR